MLNSIVIGRKIQWQHMLWAALWVLYRNREVIYTSMIEMASAHSYTEIGVRIGYCKDEDC